MVSLSKKLLLLFLSATLFACGSMREEIVPKELTAEASKLVVNCFISPQDTVLTAKVSRSRPVLDNDAAKGVEVFNATVTLSDGRNTVTLVYNPQQSLYTANAKALAIQAGVTYTLTVRTPDGRQVTATTSVPSAVALKSVQIDSTMLDGTVQKNFRVTGGWQNPTSTYFRMTGTVAGIVYTAPSNASYNSPTAIAFKMATNSLGLVASQDQQGTLSASASLGDGTFKKLYRSTKICLNLLHVDQAYYQYHIALDRQIQTADNPFAEPVIIPTNIQGGLGCFGSYNLSTKAITIK